MADLNLGDGQLYIDGKPVGEVRKVKMGLAPLISGLEQLSTSLQASADAMERFNYACYEWPDEIIEDVLDAEFVE